jgi:hypothetical protein
VYNGVMKQTEGRFSDLILAKRSILWVAFAQRPLTAKLQHAVSMNNAHSNLVDYSMRMAQIRQKHYCRGEHA